MPATRSLRLPLVLAAGSALVLAGCSSAAPAEQAAEPSVIAFEHDLGTTQVPTDYDTVIALDEYAAMDLFAVGVEPDEVYLTLMSTTIGAALGETDAELIDDPAFLTSPNLEELAAKAPDIIVMTATGPLVEHYEELSEIAPVVALPYSAGWRDVITATGEAFGVEERADEVVAALEEEVASVAETTASIGQVSLLWGYGDYLGTAGQDSPPSVILDELGIERVPAEQDLEVPMESDGVQMLSPEDLADHAGDLTLVYDGGYYVADSITSRPTFAGTTVLTVDGDSWFGSHPFATYWMLEDVAAIADGGEPAGPDAASERWAAFTALIGG